MTKTMLFSITMMIALYFFAASVKPAQPLFHFNNTLTNVLDQASR